MMEDAVSSVVLIGVAGGSGSGKTTFARMLQANLSENFAGILSQDSYYRDLSKQFDKDGGKVNFDHPDALEFSLLTENLKSLKRNQDIIIPQYDFVTHSRRSDLCLFVCRPVVIIDGTMILSQPEIRSLLNFAFFIDTSEEVRFQRRLYRDVRERGRTSEGVKAQFDSQVTPMHNLYVEPSKKIADRVISGEKSFGPVIQEIVFGLKGRPFNLVAHSR
jgi:uridine kinase